MTFTGITKDFSLLDEDQYNTIGAFWDELSAIYGLENLHGLGYKWKNGEICRGKVGKNSKYQTNYSCFAFSTDCGNER